MDEAAGRRHDDVEAWRRTSRCGRIATPVDRRDLGADRGAIVRERWLDLDRQLARRHEHQGARRARARALRFRTDSRSMIGRPDAAVLPVPVSPGEEIAAIKDNSNPYAPGPASTWCIPQPRQWF